MAIHPVLPDLQAYIGPLLKVDALKEKEFQVKNGQTQPFTSFIERGLLRCYCSSGDIEVSNWL